MPAITLALKQVIRSVVLVLLPISFISLIVWATAGSSQGSTADPIFASLWIWLASHQIPLLIEGSMVGAKLTLLPLGALVLVFFGIRSGYLRTLSRGANARLIAPIFALFYALITTLLALLASLHDSAIYVHWYLAFPITFLIALSFTIIAGRLVPRRVRSEWEVAAAWAAASIGLLLAISALILLASLILHFTVVMDLTRVIAPGIFGGIALGFLQLLYLPNMIAATLGYISGAGAHLGSDSMIHPFIHRLDQLPAIPLLGALPRGTFPYAIIGAVIVVFLGFMIYRTLNMKFGNDRAPAISLAFFALFALSLALLSSGQLVSDSLSEVGLSWWRFPSVLTGELALGMALAKVWKVWRLWQKRRSAATDVDVDSAP